MVIGPRGRDELYALISVSRIDSITDRRVRRIAVNQATILDDAPQSARDCFKVPRRHEEANADDDFLAVEHANMVGVAQLLFKFLDQAL